MAYTATNQTLSAQPAFAARAMKTLGAFVTNYIEARSRSAKIHELELLTDAELAKRGLTRDGIVRHVFSDTFYL